MKDKKEERGEEEVEQVEKGEERRKTIEDLNHLATVGGGRFFHYQVSGMQINIVQLLFSPEYNYVLPSFSYT